MFGLGSFLSEMVAIHLNCRKKVLFIRKNVNYTEGRVVPCHIALRIVETKSFEVGRVCINKTR